MEYLQTDQKYPQIFHMFCTAESFDCKAFRRFFHRFHTPYYYYDRI